MSPPNKHIKNNYTRNIRWKLSRKLTNSASNVFKQAIEIIKYSNRKKHKKLG
jgi:hypothetical protein